MTPALFNRSRPAPAPSGSAGLRGPLMTRRGALGALAASATALTLGACAPRSSEGRADTIDYWLWDASQLPAYQACADAFLEESGITVRITQIGWDDYWTKLTAGFVAGTGPDVFTNHIAKFAQFVDLEVLVPLDEQAAWSGVDASAFQPGLIDLWKGEDGHQYGCPKDWDTEAVFYNKDMVAQAGLNEQDLATWEWNPQDGGTFERILARLSVDRNGVRGDEPGFDAAHVATYGLGIQNAGAGDGQTQWSPFTGSVGEWHYTDQETWGTRYRYDDPDFQRTLDWYFGLVDKGFLCPNGAFSDATSTDVQLGSGAVAMAINGSWMFNTFAGLEVNVGVAANPKGPNGTSQSLFNGLGDSIVKQSTKIEAASRWVAFLGTAKAQDIVASHGIVFPAISSSSAKAIEVFAETGLPTEPFTQHVEDGTTFFFPLTYFGADVTAIMTPAVEALWADRVPASTLTQYNEQVNLLFETSTHD
ncbi:sugar ABC transporter substrate-binding protein [Actinomyces bowdenii]|uniref:Sugar ABC transporter substrate-binding protein n=2 Tax=Actinomyces bowdenii TaxID=131109 RepID=A0A853EFK2_9ACTO|nr:sugar ABC transporter substrate-binding protein [Actinomyces bowdenii]MBF0695896.1 sugar ABC transporter substrate-binding protein [Actinomyces bowdenii]MDO5063439.1 sugar ABC transporter substrate-binding protein [Actinomyces bowdenii]NYS68069.1 sugar ABC transporter substrate-binding protein [Actinomyces bowdenii]